MSVTADCDLWIQAIDRPSQGGDAQKLSAVGSAGRVASSAPSQLRWGSTKKDELQRKHQACTSWERRRPSQHHWER